MIVQAIIGGTLIGVAAVWMLLSLGRIAGISGIAAQALRSPKSALWAVMFVLGLGVGGGLAIGLGGASTTPALQLAPHWFVIGGVIVGFGTRLGSGCTSGHGVCGIARLSPRSIVATLTFVGIGMLTGTLLHSSGLLAS